MKVWAIQRSGGSGEIHRFLKPDLALGLGGVPKSARGRGIWPGIQW